MEKSYSNSITEKRTTEGSFWNRAWEMYRDGFRNMGRTGKQLWLLIFIKLFIMFAILKVFFFPNFLKQQSSTEEGRADYVGHELVERIAE